MAKPFGLIFIFIVITGAILRLWGIGFGLPYQFHQDEPMMVNHAMAYGTGDLNPHYFVVPPIVSYLLFFIYSICFMIGKVVGIFPNLNDFALSFFKDPTAFYLIGRFFAGFIPGILSIIFVRKLYKSIFPSDGGGIFSAAVVSFSFINIINSHYIYVDTMVAMFVILALYAIFRMRSNPNNNNYLLSGLSIGLAIGSKYNAALLLAPFLLTHLAVSRKKPINAKLMIGVGAVVVTFFVVNPFALLDYRFLISSIARQSRAESFTGLFHHIGYSLYESIGFGLLITGIAGLATMAVRNKRNGIVFVSFPALYYLHLVFFSQHFSRYAIPLVPFLAIGGGYLIFECILPVLKNRTARIVLITVCFVIFIPLIAKSVKADFILTSKDTRIEAAEWCDKNINNHSRIAFDHTFFRPVVFQDKEQLLEKYNSKNSALFFKDLKVKRVELMIQAQADKKSYYLYFLNQFPASDDLYVTVMPYVPFDLELLKNKGIEYVVINYTDQQMKTESFYKKLKNESVLVASFSPYTDKIIRMPYDKVETTGLPIVSREIYSRSRSGPAIEIYKLNK